MVFAQDCKAFETLRSEEEGERKKDENIEKETQTPHPSQRSKGLEIVLAR